MNIDNVLTKLSEEIDLPEQNNNAKEFAPGIPANKKIHDIKFSKPDIEISIQKHEADKAGKHFDFRLVDKKKNQAHSWALRYLPSKKNEKRLAIQQPTHTADYSTFSGTISEGYGAGKVNLFKYGPGKILSNSNKKIDFNFGKKKFSLVRTNYDKDGKKWLLIKR